MYIPYMYKYVYTHLVFILHTFRYDLLDLENFSWDLSFEKIDSPSLHSHWLPISLCLGLEPCEISPIGIGRLTGLASMQV